MVGAMEVASFAEWIQSSPQRVAEPPDLPDGCNALFVEGAHVHLPIASGAAIRARHSADNSSDVSLHAGRRCPYHCSRSMSGCRRPTGWRAAPRGRVRPPGA